MSNSNEKPSTGKKILFICLSVLFNYIVPFIIVAIKFGVFEKSVSNGYKFTIIGLFLTIVLAIKFSKQLGEFIDNTIKNVWVKKILVLVKNVAWCVLIFFALEYVKEQIMTIQFLSIVIIISFTIGNFFWQDYKNMLKKDEKYQQKQEMLDTLREFENTK